MHNSPKCGFIIYLQPLAAQWSRELLWPELLRQFLYTRQTETDEYASSKNLILEYIPDHRYVF